MSGLRLSLNERVPFPEIRREWMIRDYMPEIRREVMVRDYRVQKCDKIND